MNEMLLKRMAIQSVAFMLLIITISYALRRYQSITIEASNKKINSTDESLTSDPSSPSDRADNVSKSSKGDICPGFHGIMEAVDQNIIAQMSNRYLIIKKPEGDSIELRMEDLYVTKSIRIILTGLSGDEISSASIARVNENEIFTGEPIFTEVVVDNMNTAGNTLETEITKDYGNDIVHSITIHTAYDELHNDYAAELLLELDNVYAHILQEDSNYYYIDLRNPSDVYDKILVIDAGHGGKDAGALSKDERYYEKDMNLDILLQLKELLDQENIKVYYTRLSDETVFLRPRVMLANAVNCDFFISIHCNASTAAEPNGTEVLYYDREFEGVKSKDLAQVCLDELAKNIPIKKQGLVEKKENEIFILKKATVPAIIVEVGYMTNNNDMEFLSSPANRKAAAEGIYHGIMAAYKTLRTEDQH